MNNKNNWKLKFLKTIGVPSPEKCNLGHNFDICSGELLQILSEEDSELLLYYTKDEKSIDELACEYEMKPNNVRSCIYYAESVAKWTGLGEAFYKGYNGVSQKWKTLCRQDSSINKSTLTWFRYHIPDYLFDVSISELNLSRRAITVLNKYGFYRFKDIQDYFGEKICGGIEPITGLGTGVMKELVKKFPEIGIDVLEVSDNL